MRAGVALGFLSLTLGAFGLLSTFWAMVCLGHGEFPTVLVAVGAAMFGCGMVVMLSKVGTRAVSVRVAVDDAETTFRPDRQVEGYLMAAIIGLWTAMVLYATLAPMNMVQVPSPRGDRQYLIGTAIVGALVGLPSLRQILVKRGMSYLRLSPDGWEMGNSYSSVSRSWDDVTDVSDRPADGRRPINTGSTYITTTDGRTRLLPSDWYTPGGDAMRDLVRFYWQHPERRDDLVDGRAAERLRGAL